MDNKFSKSVLETMNLTMEYCIKKKTDLGETSLMLISKFIPLVILEIYI